MHPDVSVEFGRNPGMRDTERTVIAAFSGRLSFLIPLGASAVSAFTWILQRIVMQLPGMDTVFLPSFVF